MAINEVKVNGQVALTTRGDTVSPDTLAQGRTATDHTGEKIEGTGGMDNTDAYLITDPVGQVSDDDYIPFNDVSDPESPKKKTLFSAFIDKLKGSFLKSKGEKFDLDTATDTMDYKSTDIDGAYGNNNVTGMRYPSTMNILDRMKRIIMRTEAVVNPNGKIGWKSYVKNYDTDGNVVGQKGMQYHMDKSGNLEYTIDDFNAFRAAIQTIDQLGTTIPADSDLNDYMTAGTYRVPDDATAADIENLPLALCGKVVVLNNGNGGYSQVYIPNHEPRLLTRSYWNSAWGDWKEFELKNAGDVYALITGANITDPDMFRKNIKTIEQLGTDIPANSDLNDYKDAGTYRISPQATAQTIANIPNPLSGKLIVMTGTTQSANYRIQIYITYTAISYMRYFNGDNSTWSAWIRLATTGDIDSLQYQINDIENYYSAKNMIPVSNTHFDGHTNNGITYSVDMNNIVTANGTATAESRFYFMTTSSKDKFGVENGKTYTLSGGDTNNNCQIELALFKNGVWLSGKVWRTEGGKKTFTIPSDADYDTASVYLRVNNGVTVTNKKFYPVLCLGSVEELSYTPHAFTNQEISNNLITLVNRDSLPKNDDLNNYYRAGVYIIDDNAVASTISNMPESGASGKLVVIQTGKRFKYATQLFIKYEGNAYYSRSTNDSGATWTSWIKLASTDDIPQISPSAIGNGYAVGTLSGTAITATITGFKLQAGVIVSILLNTNIPANATLNISSTGAKSIYIRNRATQYGDLFGSTPNCVFTFMYDGTYYRIISHSSLPFVQEQGLVADTGGSVTLTWGAQTNASQIKFNVGNGRLQHNYYKNSSWRGDKTIVDVTGGLTMEGWLGLKTCTNGRTVSSGAHSLAVQDTIPNIINELRYSNGAWGSFNLGTAYTLNQTTIPTGWYNYFYIPHRVGGENWATPTSWDADNVNYGTLLLFGMNNTNGMFRIRWQITDNAISVKELEDLQKGNCYVGTCTTAADQKDKVATVDGNFTLRKGVRIAIKFTNTNTYNSQTSSPVTLNVNGTGAKNIWGWSTHSGAGNTGTNTTFYGVAGRFSTYMYDGTYWVWIGQSGEADTVDPRALGFGYGTCNTAAATVAKVVTLSSYTLRTGGYVTVRFDYDVPASATMNINSRGAKAIYYRGAAITAGVIRGGDRATFIYNGSQYDLVGIDRDSVTVELTQTLAANATQVTFTGLPTSGNICYDIYTSKAGLNYTAIDDATSGQLKITFPAQSAAVTVYLRYQWIG